MKLDNLDKKFFLAFEKVLIPKLIEKTPVKTGNARGSWRIEPKGNMKFMLINDNEYVKVLEEGSKPYIIRAKNKKYLRFMKKAGKRKSVYKKIPGNQAFEKNGYIFAKAVNHPGITARHFIRDILNNSKTWDDIFEEVFKN